MVLDCPVILHEVHQGVPRMGEAYYEDGLEDGLYGHDNALAFTTLIFNGHDVQQQPHPVVYNEELLSFLIVFTLLRPWPFPQEAVLFCV